MLFHTPDPRDSVACPYRRLRSFWPEAAEPHSRWACGLRKMVHFEVYGTILVGRIGLRSIHDNSIGGEIVLSLWPPAASPHSKWVCWSGKGAKSSDTIVWDVICEAYLWSHSVQNQDKITTQPHLAPNERLRRQKNDPIYTSYVAPWNIEKQKTRNIPHQQPIELFRKGGNYQ